MIFLISCVDYGIGELNMNISKYKHNSFSDQLVPYITKNTLNGIAKDLLDDYLESYSGLKNLEILSNDDKLSFGNKIELIKKDIIENIDNTLYKEIRDSNMYFLSNELERKVSHLLKKEI